MGMDIFGNNDTYFRANIWQWRAICHVMERTGFEVPFGWSVNDGEGFTSRAECDELAERLTTFLDSCVDVLFVMPSDLQVDINGKFVEPGTPGARSPYVVSREHLVEFIEFLRNCGGEFRIC